MRFEKQIIKLSPNKQLRVDAFNIRDKRVIGVFGGSGYGKSCFLQYIYTKYHNKERMVYMRQDIFLHSELSVYETLWFYAMLHCREECSNIEKILQQVGIDHLKNCRVEGLSGGEKKRIMIAYCLLDETSRYILMDEPFSGLDTQNINMIFLLMLEKIKKCTILFTAHQLPSGVYTQLDEIWEIVQTDTGFYLESRHHDFSEISLCDDNNDNNLTTLTTPIHQWKYLFLRDRIIDRKKGIFVFLKWATPLIVVGIQQALIGSFSSPLKKWEKTGSMADLFTTILLNMILLFTVSMAPMHMLNDHFHKRVVTQHEIKQGIYSPAAYLLSAILWDQLSLTLISLCIVLMLMPSDALFATTFFSVMMQMNTTNLLMWLCSLFPKSSFNTTLILVSTYIAISFIENLGMFLKGWSFLQYTSMVHIHSNLFLERISALYPNNGDNMGFVFSCINNHKRLGFWTWMGMSISMYSILIIFIIIINNIH